MPIFCSSNKIGPLKDLTEIRQGRKLFISISTPSIPENGTIFFIHGVGGSEFIWRYQVGYFLSKGYRTITIDLIGHGASPIVANRAFNCCTVRKWFIFSTSKSCCVCARCPRTQDLKATCTFDEHFKDVEAAFDEYILKYYASLKESLNTGNPSEQTSPIVTVVAHSYGTSLAVRLAESRGEAIHRLVLISGGAPMPLEFECSIFMFPPLCLALLTPCIQLGFQSLAFSKGNRSRDADHGLEERRAAFQFNAYTLWATMAGQKWLEGDRNFYARLRVPVLLICGCRDRLVSLEEEEETLLCLHCARLRRLPEAGHMGMLEDPDRVNEFIYEHIVNPPLPLEPSRRTQPRTTDNLTNRPIISQPIFNYGPLDALEDLKYSNPGENENCRMVESEELSGFTHLFRPRIHSKRWRGSERCARR